MTPPRKTRVLIIERSVGMMIRLLAFFEARPDIEVVEANKNVNAFMDAPGMELRSLMDALSPDAVIVDPREPLGGDLIWIARLREMAFVPIIAYTACAAVDGRIGAVRFFDVVARPAPGDEESLLSALKSLAFAVRRARRAGEPARRACAAFEPIAAGKPPSAVHLIAIGASAGGTEAVAEIVTALPARTPPVLVVQHIAKGFAELFAENLDRRGTLACSVARDGEIARDGHVYVAPDARQMIVSKGTEGYVLRCVADEKKYGHCPSVGALFDSVAAAAGENAIGVLLTGMGKDGAEGLKHMRERGAYTIGQDERSSLVYGMPKAAWELGAVVRQLPLDRIAGELIMRTP